MTTVVNIMKNIEKTCTPIPEQIHKKTGKPGGLKTSPYNFFQLTSSGSCLDLLLVNPNSSS